MRWFAPFAFTLTGCASSAPADDLLPPPPVGEGIQIRMVGTIAAGQETERCQFFVVPPGGLNIDRERVRYVTGSHHVLLFTTNYQAVPSTNLLGEPVDTSDAFDCSAGVFGSWDVRGIAAAAQNPDAPDVVMPPGVAIRLPAGAVLLMNTHYLDATPAPLDTDTRINLHSIPDAEVKDEAGFLLFYDPFIRVPALGASSARMRCPVPHDVNLVSLTSHMHRRGVHFSADLVDAAGAPQETLFETTLWEEVPTAQWASGKPIPAGTAIDYHCDYANGESRVIAQGPTTKDEMCVLTGAYYPRDPGFEACSSLGLAHPDHDATWIGDGKLTCLDAITCAEGAADAASFYGCVVDSCPASGPSLSALLHCQDDATRGAGSPCYDACPAGSAISASCRDCIAQSCGPQVSACVAASCG
jgi:hypothetical protein